MIKRESFPIAKIYVPVKRRATLRPEAVREIAESMLEIGQATPILVRSDGERTMERARSTFPTNYRPVRSDNA
jgi:hypothetical protein